MLNHIEKALENLGYTGQGSLGSKAVSFFELLRLLEFTKAQNILKAITDIKSVDIDNDFFNIDNIEEITQVLKQRADDPNAEAYTIQELGELLVKASDQDLAALFAYLGQGIYRKPGERFDKASQVTLFDELINRHQDQLSKHVQNLGCFDEQLPEESTQADLAIVHGSAMNLVQSRLNFFLEHKNLLADDSRGIFCAGGDRSLITSAAPSDREVEGINGNFIDLLLQKEGSEEGLEYQGIQYLLELRYGLLQNGNDSEITVKGNQVPCTIIYGTRDISENPNRTDTYGATRQMVRDILQKDPDFFNQRRDIISVSNDIYTYRQALCVKRAFMQELTQEQLANVHIHPMGGAKKGISQINAKMLSDVVGAHSKEMFFDRFPILNKVKEVILLQSRLKIEKRKTEATTQQVNNKEQKTKPKMISRLCEKIASLLRRSKEVKDSEIRSSLASTTLTTDRFVSRSDNRRGTSYSSGRPTPPTRHTTGRKHGVKP